MDFSPAPRAVLRGGLLLAALLWPAASGCAKVGDPLPPLPRYPSTIQDLRADRTAAGVQLLFSIPSEDIRYVEIHRQCDPRAAGDRIQLIERLAWEELRDSGQPGVFNWEDRAAPAGGDCRYALRFLNQQGLPSEFSNFARP